MRVTTLLSAFLLLGFSGCQEKEAVLPADTFGRDWYNTFEKDRNDFFLFTPVAVAKGWQYDGFRLEPDGTFLEYGLGPADAPETRPGTWKEAGKQTYQIQFKDAQRQGYTLYLQPVSGDILKARRAY